MLLLIMAKNIPIFNIFIPTFLQCVLQTFDKVAYVEIINGKPIIQVIILRQEHEGKCWFNRSRSLKMSVTGKKIDSTAHMSDRATII